MNWNWQHATDASYLLLRLAGGWMFFQAGALKMFGWFGGMPAGMESPPPFLSQVWFAAALELIGGPLIMAGAITRPVAFILSGEMAVAYWQFAFPQGTWPVQNNGVPAALYCFVFLFMSAYGGGAWSVDAWWKRRGK